MIVKNAKKFRAFYKREIIRNQDPTIDLKFIGSIPSDNKNREETGFAGMIYGRRPFGHYLSTTSLNVAADDQAIYELIQNADDSSSSLFVCVHNEEYLLCINNGTPFSNNDMAAILNVGDNGKGGEQIGSYGIGFKILHRLVGEDDGLNAIINNYAGPIIFSWYNRRQLEDFLNVNNSIVVASEFDNDEQYPWLVKLIYTCFPTHVNEMVKLKDYDSEGVVYSHDELIQMRNATIKAIRPYLNHDITHGSIFFIKLGKNKYQFLNKGIVKIKQGLGYSMRVLNHLKTVFLDGEEISRCDVIQKNINIPIGSDNFNKIKPKNQERDIRITFAYHLNYKDASALQEFKMPNFYTYFSMDEECDGLSFVIHCNAFDMTNDRRKLQPNSQINERLLPIISKHIVDYLEDLSRCDRSLFLSLYSNLLMSKDQTKDNVKILLFDNILNALKKQIPCSDNSLESNTNFVVVKDVQTPIDLTSVGINCKWFYWNGIDMVNEPIVSRATQILGLKHISIQDMVEMANIDLLNNWLQTTDISSRNDFFNELVASLNVYPRKEAKDRLKYLKLFSVKGICVSMKDIIDNPTYILTTNVNNPIKDILNSIGLYCTDDIFDNHILHDYLEAPKDESVFERIMSAIKDRNISPSDKRSLFLTFESDGFKGVAEGKLSTMELFNNLNGTKTPLKKLMKFREGCQEWLKPYVLAPEEYFVELDKYIINNEDEYNSVIATNIDDILDDTCIMDLYYTYKSYGWNLTEYAIRKYGVTKETLTIVEEQGGNIAIKVMIEKASSDILSLKSSCSYSENDDIYRIIAIVAASTDENKNLLKGKISIDGTSLSNYTVKNEIVLKKSEKEYTLLLSDILPNDQQGKVYSSVSCQFDRIRGDSIFSNSQIDLTNIDARLRQYLNSGGRITPSQYAYINLRGSLHNLVNMRSEEDVLSVMQFFYIKNWGSLLKDSLDTNIRYGSNALQLIKGKYLFSDDFTLEYERVPSYIQSWCVSESHLKFLVGLGFHDSQSSEIKRRRDFKNNVLEKWDVVLNTAPSSFINWIKTFPTFTGDKQIGILRFLCDSSYLKYSYNTEEDYKDAVEWEHHRYLAWRSTNSLTIKMMPSSMPVRIVTADNTVLARVESPCPDYYYSSSTRCLYIDSTKEDDIDAVLTKVYSDNDNPFTKDDWTTLVLGTAEEAKEKDNRIKELEAQLANAVQNGYTTEVVDHGNKSDVGNLIGNQREDVNRDAREKAYEYLKEHESEGYKVVGNIVDVDSNVIRECVEYRGKKIVVVITSSKKGVIYLRPWAFADLMSNHDNLLINYDGNKTRTLSFEDIFKENPNVNLIFDTDHVNPKLLGSLAVKFKGSKKTTFAISNPSYSISEEIKGFGLDVVVDGEAFVDYQNDEIFNW